MKKKLLAILTLSFVAKAFVPPAGEFHNLVKNAKTESKLSDKRVEEALHKFLPVLTTFVVEAYDPSLIKSKGNDALNKVREWWEKLPKKVNQTPPPTVHKKALAFIAETLSNLPTKKLSKTEKFYKELLTSIQKNFGSELVPWIAKFLIANGGIVIIPPMNFHIVHLVPESDSKK